MRVNSKRRFCGTTEVESRCMLLLPLGAALSTTLKTGSYRFGPFEADLDRAELRKLGVRVRLERKPWAVARLPA